MIKEFLKVIVRHIAGITVRHKMKQTSGVELLCACCFLLLSPFLEPAPLCMINLLSLIIYVIQNVIYVNVNFELWPEQWIVNLSPQTLSRYTLVDSSVWSTHKSLQTGAKVHILPFIPTVFLTQVRGFGLDKMTGEHCWLLGIHMWTWHKWMVDSRRGSIFQMHFSAAGNLW